MSLHPEAGGPGPMMYRPRRKEPPMSDLEKDGGLHMTDLRAEMQAGLDDAIQLLSRPKRYLGSADQWAVQQVLDAARRFASLTSPETIEKAAKAIADLYNDEDDYGDMEIRQQRRGIVLAVLRSVEEGEIDVTVTNSESPNEWLRRKQQGGPER